MPSDIELRRMVDALKGMQRELSIHNRIMTDMAQAVIGIRRELARGNEAAEARSRSAEEAGDAGGREADWLIGSGGGQSPEAVRQGPSPARTPQELAQEYEAKRPNHGE